MGYGLFGKMPQKRDFLALGLSRAVLEPFETWLQSAVAASRSDLGGSWQEQYLVAPIWRFWIGKEIFGAQCAGALMPSVDGVGRFFPLAILYCAEADEDIPPPVFEPRGDWYGAIEDRLLSVLDPEIETAPDRLTEGLPKPVAAGAISGPLAADTKRGFAWRGDEDVDAFVTTLVASELRALAPTRSYWWTRGTAESGAMVYSRNALPDPFFYTLMIRGSLA